MCVRVQFSNKVPDSILTLTILNRLFTEFLPMATLNCHGIRTSAETSGLFKGETGYVRQKAM
jgi:hypothetical protein